MADRVLSALVKVRIEESGTRADQKLLDDYRLNDEGRNARQAETYSFEERELTDSLTELGLTPGQLRDAHEMGNLMKGYITSTPLPIYKEINGERKPLGEACFYAVREEGRTIVKALPVLKSPQYDMTAYKELFTDRQRKQLAAFNLGAQAGYHRGFAVFFNGVLNANIRHVVPLLQSARPRVYLLCRSV